MLVIITIIILLTPKITIFTVTIIFLSVDKHIFLYLCTLTIISQYCLLSSNVTVYQHEKVLHLITCIIDNLCNNVIFLNLQ